MPSRFKSDLRLRKALGLSVGLVFAALIGAQTVFVVPSDTPGQVPNYPYANWTDAATSIHVAVAAAVAQNWTNVVVSNGLYVVTNPVVVTTGIYMRSWNNGALDRTNTVISGGGVTNGVVLSNVNAVLDGFTISNCAQVPGLRIYSGVARNCEICFCSNRGVQIWANGVLEDSSVRMNFSGGLGGAGIVVDGGIIRHCEIVANVQSNATGGGVYILGGGRLLDSSIISNYHIVSNNSWAGGVMIVGAGFVSNCFVQGNRAYAQGGGVYLSAGLPTSIVVDACTIIENFVGSNGNGGGVHMTGGTLRNSLIARNYADRYAGGVYALQYSNVIENCTIVSNHANGGGGGGMRVTNTYGYVVLNNNVIYFNTGGANSNYALEGAGFWTNNCTAPSVDAYGSGNITSDPQFISLTGGNYRLKSTSPCINAGQNQGWMSSALDRDGAKRVRFGTVDIGCYEYPYPEISATPVAQTNTVVEGGQTSGVLTLTVAGVFSNYAGEAAQWGISKTNSWITLGATNGAIAVGGTATVVWTNNAAVLGAGGYTGRLALRATNGYAALDSSPPAAGIAEMRLEVLGLRVDPAVVSNAVMMGFNAPAKTLRVWNAGLSELAWTAQVSAGAAGWLSVVPANGVSTGGTAGATNVLSLQFTTTNLAIGEYFGQVVVTGLLGGAARVVDVRLNVNAPGGLSVSPAYFNRDVMEGLNPSSDTLAITNLSAFYDIIYGVTVASGGSWLAVSGATGGVLSAGGTVNVTVNYNASNLPQGQYTGLLRVTNAVVEITEAGETNVSVGAPHEVPVLLRVNPRPTLAVSADAVSNVVSEGNDAPKKAFQVWNGSGFYTLTYTIRDNVPWLIPSVSSGTSTGEHDIIELDYSTAGLAVGVYTGVLTVTAAEPVSGTNRHAIRLYLEVTGMAGLGCDGSAQDYTLRLGSAPVSSSFYVWNTGASTGTSLRWSITASNAGWLAVEPAEGVLGAGSPPQQIQLTCDPSGLAPGHYSAILRVSGVDTETGAAAHDSPYDIRVSMWVRAGDSLHFGGQTAGSELVVYGTENGWWYVRDLEGTLASDCFGAYGYIPVPGDYNGDGVVELGVYRPASGSWYWKEFGSGDIRLLGNWGGAGYEPVRGDYDGDGKYDFVLYSETLGVWYALLSAYNYAPASAVFGGPGCRPVRGDYDDDGKADPVLYQEASGAWHALLSSLNYRYVRGMFGGLGYTGFGGDYDGDGRSELCLYHTSGRWYILTVDNRALLWGAWWGGSGWEALAGDYDGDGVDDLAIYQSATGNWRIRRLDGTVLLWDVPWGGYGYQAIGR